MATDYPEHAKLTAVADKSQAIGEFLEWLQGRCTICRFQDAGNNGKPRYVWTVPVGELVRRGMLDEGRPWTADDVAHGGDAARGQAAPNPEFEEWGEGYRPVFRRIEDWLAEYFQIDLAKVEAEKKAMLAQLRAANK
jgi:hypothetical protein